MNKDKPLILLNDKDPGPHFREFLGRSQENFLFTTTIRPTTTTQFPITSLNRTDRSISTVFNSSAVER